jgi:hypothetical protein
MTELTQFPSDGKTINTYLPLELLREIFLYSIESNQIKSGQLASVCCNWNAVVVTLPQVWSTLRVGTQTEREQVTTWLQRAYPKKVVIDTRTGDQSALPFAVLQDAFASTSEWCELTISSFPSEQWASQFGFDVASPTNVLKVLHVAAGCVHSPSFAHLLNLVPTDAPLSELRLHPSFATAHFLQPHWLPPLQNLTVLILNGRDIHDPFDLLPAFTRLHTFEADHLAFPWYGPDTNLPLLGTLQKLQLRASSVQWMAGREFSCLEECAILLPRDCDAVQLHEVQFPTCKTLTYHGYPMTTVQYFHLPEMKVMELRSHDYKTRRVCQQLHQLCTVDGRISKLTTLHLTLQCSEQALIKLLKYLGLLQALNLSIAHCSPSWQTFLESLIATPARGDWTGLGLTEIGRHKWESWRCASTWHSILPHLKYLGIRCPKDLSQSEWPYNSPLLRLVAWTRKEVTPLEHLKVWEGRGTIDDIIVVDYVSDNCWHMRPGLEGCDINIVKGMVTRRLLFRDPVDRLFQLRSTILFSQLHDLEIDYHHDHEITILPFLDELKRLVIWHGIIPAYSLTHYLPLFQTLQSLRMGHSSFSWMLGRTFKALREFSAGDLLDTLEVQVGHETLQVVLPACKTLKLWDFSANHLRFLSCPNVRTLQWGPPPALPAIDAEALRSLQDFLFTCSRLQTLDIPILHHSGRDSLIQFVFCDALEQGLWRDIMSVRVRVTFTGSPSEDRYHFFSKMVGHQRRFDKWWKEFTVTNDGMAMMVTVRASM